ncbi:MAG: class I SAM-dependent RNA methyltransferase [Anaerolineae bacterium]
MARKKRSKNNQSKPPYKGKRSRGGRTSPGQMGDMFEIELQTMANGGFALGHHQRRTTFIPYTIPGEIVRARVVEQQKHVDFAQGVELLNASADRVYPQCPHFGPGQCWGCQWQHIDYPAQLLLKQDVLADQLYRLGKFEDAVVGRALQAVIPAPDQWAYNYNTTLIRDPQGRFGYYKIDGRAVMTIDECVVMHPILQELFTLIDMDFSDVERMQLWVGSDEQTMVVLEMNSEDMPELSADFATSVNVVLPDNEPINLVGESMIHYEIAERPFRVTVGGSFRANIAQIQTLIGTVLNLLALNEHDRVLDLYAGVGIFSAFLAPRAQLVTLVESYPPTATDAEENLRDFDNVDIIEGTVEEVLRSLQDAEERYQAVVLDPPASGVSREALETLIALEIPRVVYVSSDPASFARDARQMARHGYELTQVQPIDFAPQTYYIDTVALLTRTAK